MTETTDSQLIREATSIFIRLRDHPQDPDLLSERDRFLAGGKAHRKAYSQMLAAWQVTGQAKKDKPSRAPLVALALACLVGGFFAKAPIEIYLRADLTTDTIPRITRLVSGDRATLDGTTALIDHTSDDIRQVELLRGAAFFDVRPDGRPFVVTSGELTVEVLGTSFEVGAFEDAGIVTVAEGAVRVTVGSQSWQLIPGEQLIWSAETGATRDHVGVAHVASWRDDVLVADGLSFAQIAEILDRRIPGRVVLTDAELGQQTIVGRFELRDAQGTLDLLAKLTGAKVTSVPNLAYFVRR